MDAHPSEPNSFLQFFLSEGNILQFCAQALKPIDVVIYGCGYVTHTGEAWRQGPGGGPTQEEAAVGL